MTPQPAGQVHACRGLDRRGQRRPGGGADSGTGRLAAVRLVLAVGVQRQAAAAGQHRPGRGVRDLQGRHRPGRAQLDDVPGAFLTVARDLARGPVADVGVDREAVEGDLPDPAGTGDHPERAGQAHARRGLDRRGQRRPGDGAATGTHGFAAVRLVCAEVIQRQAAPVGQHHPGPGGLGLQHDGLDRRRSRGARGGHGGLVAVGRAGLTRAVSARGDRQGHGDQRGPRPSWVTHQGSPFGGSLDP